jgi:eukaryotic-like serine/threonine-protein kinase
VKPPGSESDDDGGLAEIAEPPGTPAPGSSQRPDVTSRLGMVLRGKYRLESVLGVGGMAVVYRAIHRNQAEYAIKMLLPEHAANEELRTRFLREGYAANSVKHPAAVRVVDDDVAEDGTAFLVLELLHGIACDKLCLALGGKLPVEAACAIGLQALDVLRAAHLNGIIHRDIKPANLFLLRSGEVKVLDFGIARVRETLATGALSTGSGVLLGTPAFMAPEQAMGKASDVDARADIWAIGATLFALMSGLTVHEGDSGRELLVKLVTQPTRSVLEVLPEIPEAIADVVDRALDVDRENRWSSATAMRDALDGASRSLWQERPPRAVLATIAESIVPVPAPSTQSFDELEARRRSQVPPAAPTLRAQETPQASDAPPKQAIETARAVSHSGRAVRPRRRASLLIVLAVLTLGAGLTVIAVAMMRGHDESPPLSPSTGAPVAEPVVTTPPVPASAPPTTPEQAKPLEAVAPAAATAMIPSEAGPAVRTRGAPKQERAAATPSAAPIPAAQTSSSPVGASAATESPAASAHPATPANCNPPYYYDSKMNRVFKKECL